MRRTMTPGNGEPERPAVELHPVMTDRTLADRDDEPAHLIGHGPVPAAISRDLLTADERTRVWVRRLFTDPGTGNLLATDARRRDCPPTARQFLAAHDQICRTPWCGAPIREADHALAVSRGGPTDLRNGNGRCTACNLVKDLDGWTTRVDDTRRHHHHHTHRTRPPQPATPAPDIPTLETAAVPRPRQAPGSTPTADRDPLARREVQPAGIPEQSPGSVIQPRSQPCTTTTWPASSVV